MPSKKQYIICPECQLRFPIVYSKWNGQYKDYNYFSVPHRHPDNNFYAVRASSTGKMRVYACDKLPEPVLAITKSRLLQPIGWSKLFNKALGK